jgi:hypothetical protein
MTIASIDAQIKSLHKKIRDLKTQRNALTPFGRLPVELLAIIFQKLQRPASSVLKSKHRLIDWKWLRVMRVCKYFRDVALATPELWSKIDCDMPASWAETCIARSRGRSLTLSASTDGDDSEEHADRVEKLAAQYFAQARTIVLNLDGHEERIQTLALRLASTMPAPLLEEFRYMGGAQFRLVSLTFGKRNETLRKLSLNNVVFHGCPLLPALEQLELEDYCFREVPGLDGPIGDISELLKRTPSLTSLSLVRFDPGDTLDGDSSSDSGFGCLPMPDPLPSIDLPQMRSLYLEESPSHTMILLKALPEPKDALKITVQLSNASQRLTSPPTSKHAEVMDHITSFWSRKSGETHLPTGKIWTARFPGKLRGENHPETHTFLTFGTRMGLPEGQSNVFYETQATITQFSPLLGYIKTFHMSGDRVGPSYVEKDSGAEHLLDLDDVGLEDFKTAKHLDAVEKWLKKRHSAGRVTKSIQFCQYPEKIASKVLALAQRLERAGFVGQVFLRPKQQLQHPEIDGWNESEVSDDDSK